MTKSLQEMLRRVETWPASRQEDAAEILKSMEGYDRSGLRISDEQAAEIQRRMADGDVATIPFEDAFRRFRSSRV